MISPPLARPSTATAGANGYQPIRTMRMATIYQRKGSVPDA